MQASTTRLIVVAAVFTMVGAAIAGFSSAWLSIPGITPGAHANATPQVRDFRLSIVPHDVDMGGGAVWHAWTFNGTVPGPTLVANVGDVIRVTVHNTMNITHSFHTHLSPYSLENDGSQLNIITGIGGMAMIPAGGTYTYEYVASIPGVFYYHCHSADGGHTIHEHMAQGLYGAIIVHGAEELPVHDEVIFMSERGYDVNDPNAPFYIMNGHGLPGGEHKLEEIFGAKGVPGVTYVVGKGYVPAIVGRVDVPVRLDVINIGDVVHTFHLHGMTAYYEDRTPVPAQVVGLAPGEARQVTVTPTEPGLWLYHCHVVSHADGGMIGVFIVEPKTGNLTLPPPDNTTAPLLVPGHVHPPVDANATTFTVTAGTGGGELTYTPSILSVAKAGTVKITFTNAGAIPHTFTVAALGADSGRLQPGQSATLTVTLPQKGTFEYRCTEPGHADAGMRGQIVVG